MLAVTRAMLELQRLQWECTAANCRLDPAFFGTFLANCRALPADEQLLVMRELIDQLRHQQQMQASGSASAASVVLLPVSPLSRPPVAMSVASAISADQPDHTGTPAAEQLNFGSSAAEGPRLANGCNVTRDLAKKLVTLATTAYECLLDYFSNQANRTKRFPRARAVGAMVKEKTGHVDYVQRTKALYLNNQNICQAALRKKIDSIVIAEFRGTEHVQSNARKNKNIAIFKSWAVKALRGDPQTQSRLEQSDLRRLWEGSTDRPRLMRGQTEVCPWGWFKQHILTMDDLYDTSDGEGAGGDQSNRGERNDHSEGDCEDGSEAGAAGDGGAGGAAPAPSAPATPADAAAAAAAPAAAAAAAARGSGGGAPACAGGGGGGGGGEGWGCRPAGESAG
jgi:hypothetical protein